jgi:hypothetical protein
LTSSTARGARRRNQSVDPHAGGPSLVELLDDTERSRDVRLLVLDMLSRLPPGAGAKAVIKLAMDEKDEEIRDRCLDEVVRMKDSGVASVFIGLLTSKDNKRVNRAATCLARLEDPAALVTTHEYLILPQNGGGLSFEFGRRLSAGASHRRQAITRIDPHAALTTASRHYQYDETAWRGTLKSSRRTRSICGGMSAGGVGPGEHGAGKR